MVAKRQRQKEEADGWRGDHNRTADVRHQPAQGNNFGTERAEAFDENDCVDQEAGYPAIIADLPDC